MIRHAGLSTALSIPALPVAMIERRLRALAIAAAGTPMLLEPCMPAALQAAAVWRHASSQAALDNGDGFVAT